MDIITLAIPGFFLLIAAESFYSIRVRRRGYRFPDALSNVGCGLFQQAVEMLPRVAIVTVMYTVVWENWRLGDLPESGVLTWIIGFLGVDHSYYWWHRAHHRSNVLWGIHIVHHQSEDYNLTVALRQSPLAALTSWVVYLPLAVVGVPPAVFVTTHALAIVYQFWIHTELVGRLGPLEWVMNTPSHHRVHHGTNPEYLDRNYAGVLILWDRIYGTFEPEREPVVYGITSPLRSWNVLWANVHYYVELWRSSRARRGVRARIRVWIISPERLSLDEAADEVPAAANDGEGGIERSPRSPTKFSSVVGWGNRTAVSIPFVVVLASTVYLLSNQGQVPSWILWVNATLVSAALIFVGVRLRVLPDSPYPKAPS